MMAAWRHEQSDVSGATVHNVRRGATQLLLKNHPPVQLRLAISPNSQKCMNMSCMIYIYIYIHCVYIYIYVERERGRERAKLKRTNKKNITTTKRKR